MRPTPRHGSSLRTSGSVLEHVGKAALTSALLGLLVAALALPLVGSAGLAAKAGANDFLVLPAELNTPPLAQRSRILAADGSLLATLYSQNRVLAPLASVPELTRKALLAIEDNRFYAHNGVDIKGTVRAALTNSAGGVVRQGGSTLTQQYVKNALVLAARTPAEQAAARATTVDRKLREARYALALERQLTKDQILERYLNIAYYGNGVYGIGTAASFYFGKPVDQLTLAEGAMLAGMVQSPSLYDPVKSMPAAVARRNVVLSRMADLQYISQAQRQQADQEVPQLRLSPTGSGCEAPGVSAPFFCDFVRATLEEGPLGAVLGRTREERQQRLLAGGLTIVTTLDPRLQAAAQEAVDLVPANDPSGVAAAVDTVEPGTGQVKAMAINRTFAENGPGATKVNLATGGTNGFQAGSTFKIFVLARALQMGIPPSLTLYAPQTYTSGVFTDYKDGRRGPYTLSNAGDSEAGTFDLRLATHESVNTYFIQLEERTGVDRPAALAESLGVKQFKDGTPSAPLLRAGSFTLGSNEVSPLDMAAAYAAFAAHGLYCPPNPVREIRDAQDRPIALPVTPCTQALDRDTADSVTSILQGVIDGPAPARTGRAASIGRPAAGKTGTTDSSKAAWFIGYTPRLATSVWVGRPVPAEMRRIRIAGQYYPQVYGGTLPAAIWRTAMSAAVDGTPVEPFELSSRSKTAAVPNVSGQPVDAATGRLRDAGFEVRDGGVVPSDTVPAGATAYTTPAAGTQLPPGSAVTLFVSSGPAPSVAPQPGTGPTPPPNPATTPSGPARATPASSPPRTLGGNGTGNGG